MTQFVTMATIKSYTDIEQSRKLAEILPLRSADMYYPTEGASPRFGVALYISSNIPCWSLAALLSVLPRIDIEKEICSDDTFDYRVKAYIGDGYIGEWFDNPIDACYEMILKLNESKLL